MDQAPLLMMEVLYDVQTPVAMETAYRDTVEAAGNGDLLVQVHTNGVGHCAFTHQKLQSTIEALKYWLETGIAPSDGIFTEALGIDNAFVPPAWPW